MQWWKKNSSCEFVYTESTNSIFGCRKIKLKSYDELKCVQENRAGSKLGYVFVNNPQFLPYHYETLSNWLTQELVISSFNITAQKCGFRALLGVGAMGAMAPQLFENMLIGTHTFMGELNEL